METQISISEWAQQTFGVATSPKKLVERFVEEVVELDAKSAFHGLMTPKNFDAIQDECADCLVVLYQVAEAYGFDLLTAVDQKMEINRARKWKTAGDGVGQHID